MGARRIRREQRQADMRTSRIVNGHLKTAERARRELRMVSLIKSGKFPYTPAVQSWISTYLDKPSRLVSEAEVTALVKKLTTKAV